MATATLACDELQIVLVGTSGSGKSATANTIIGEKNVFRSIVSDQSCTVECQKENIKSPIAMTGITVIDTPGCHCTRLTDEEVLGQLKKLIDHLKPPYAFLLVIPVGYFTPKENETVSMLEKSLGKKYLEHTVIVFTKTDDLQFKTRGQFIKEGNKEFQNLIQRCDKYHFINNRDKRIEGEISQLINDLGKVAKKNNKLEWSASHPVKRNKKEDEQNITANLMTKPKTLELEQSGNTHIMVLGMKGVGKTTTIKNILLGAKHTVDGSCSVYTDDQMKMVESPGFDEDPNEIEGAIREGLALCDPGPHVMLIIMQVGRFSPAIQKTMRHIQTKLGEAANKYVIIIFTRKTDLGKISIDSFIHETTELGQIVNAFGSKYFALDNHSHDIESQVMDLKSMIKNLLITNKKTTFQRTKNSKPIRESLFSFGRGHH